MIAWATLLESPAAPDSYGDPYGEAGQAAWDACLEAAGAEAGREVLQAARGNAFGAFVEQALDPVYAAWHALGELNAGSPGGDLARPWQSILRAFWLPFVQMSVGGLALYWATLEAIVCLPLPALFLGPTAPDPADAPSVVWRSGERAGSRPQIRARPRLTTPSRNDSRGHHSRINGSNPGDGRGICGSFGRPIGKRRISAAPLRPPARRRFRSRTSPNISTRVERAITALASVSFHIPRGAFVSIVGPSGCGKSTILDLVVGTEKPSEGSIYCDGEPVSGLRSAPAT